MSKFTPYMHDRDSLPEDNGIFSRVVNAARKAASAVYETAQQSHIPGQGSSVPSGSGTSGGVGADAADMSRIVEGIEAHALTLSPLVKTHMFPDFPGIADGLVPGWAQLPQRHGTAFSLGVFFDGAKNRFHQLALADGQGRVFVSVDPNDDVQSLTPALFFSKEGEITLADSSRISRAGNRNADYVPPKALQGAVVGRDASGEPMWLSSWLSVGKRYTLEQLRLDVPRNLRVDLEYRDALAIAFFCACAMPHYVGTMGFGAGNIFRRLNHEAPLGAIRRAVADGTQAKAKGLRVSGLEEYFARLMREAGALESTKGLEAVHGREPLSLVTLNHSGMYAFDWGEALELSSALRALHIEGNLNRFAAVSAWLEHNARVGSLPIEDTVSVEQAADIDATLLRNPALAAFDVNDQGRLRLDEPSADSVQRVLHIAQQAALQNMEHDGVQPDGTGQRAQGEWEYRQTLSGLLRSLRFPFRFDADFRSNIAQGETAISLSAVGSSMMPQHRWDGGRHQWVDYTHSERVEMSVDYNLRAGLVLAALCFGASEQVNRVSLRIESLGLEQALEAQDSTIGEMIARALGALKRADVPSRGTRSKADPKDGDVHGDPAQVSLSDDHGQIRTDASTQDRAADGTDDARTARQAATASQPCEEDAAQHPAQNDAHTDNGAGSNSETAGVSGHRNDAGDDSSVDAQFADLMQGVDIDDMAIAAQERDRRMGLWGTGMHQHGDFEDDMDGADMGDGSVGSRGDMLRGNVQVPQPIAVVTVTFTREDFMRRIAEGGLDNPQELYLQCAAAMALDSIEGFAEIVPQFTLHDKRFAPATAQSEPEFSDEVLPQAQAQVLGTQTVSGLSIQRGDVLQRVDSDFQRLAMDESMPRVGKAQEAMRIVAAVGDPELDDLAPMVSRALIDGDDVPDIHFVLSKQIDDARLKARDLLFSGRFNQSIELLEQTLDEIDARYDSIPGVPRYFNSYAERVVYNRLFATPDECTVLIPDSLFYAHMELSDVMSQVQGPAAALPHLNKMVAYAPAYPLSHMRLAVQLARGEDWNSARAACLNALRVSLDGDDAAYAYYRLAYAEWMSDRLDVAAAAYMMSEHLAPGKIESAPEELHEVVVRAQSQCITVPSSPQEVSQMLASHDIPVWPHIGVAPMVSQAARVCVDRGMFIPARTLAVAKARMSEGNQDGIDMAQMQFLRSLGA